LCELDHFSFHPSLPLRPPLSLVLGPFLGRPSLTHACLFTFLSSYLLSISLSSTCQTTRSTLASSLTRTFVINQPTSPARFTPYQIILSTLTALYAIRHLDYVLGLGGELSSIVLLWLFGEAVLFKSADEAARGLVVPGPLIYTFEDVRGREAAPMI